MIFNSSGVNFGASLPENSRKPSVYLPSSVTPSSAAFSSLVAISVARMCAAVAEHDIVARLVQLAGRQFQPGRVDAPAIAEIEEAPGLVDGEDGLHPVAD